MTAATLIRRMAAGDREALARFYDRYAPMAYALILRIVRDRADADEVLRATIWDCWHGARSYDPDRGTPESWVVRRARARALAGVRTLRRRHETFVASSEALDTFPPVEHEDAPAAELGPLTRAMEKLSEAQREVIELAYYGGLSQSEIAARLKQPIGTVKTRMHFALERLRDALRFAP